DMPRLLSGLADVGRARTQLQQAFELGVLIAVGGVDVDVQPGFPLLRLIPATEDDRRLRAAEPFARPDLQRAVVLAIEHDEVQDLAPEPRQHLRVAATEHELTDTTCHERNLPSGWITSQMCWNCRWVHVACRPSRGRSRWRPFCQLGKESRWRGSRTRYACCSMARTSPYCPRSNRTAGRIRRWSESSATAMTP